MQAFNQKRKTIVAEDILTPQTLIDKTIGLLKYKKPVPMLLKTRFGIHTIGMHYSLDVLILDQKHQVVLIKKNLKPNRILLWNCKYNIVIELPIGAINASKTEYFDMIQFK